MHTYHYICIFIILLCLVIFVHHVKFIIENSLFVFDDEDKGQMLTFKSSFEIFFSFRSIES